MVDFGITVERRTGKYVYFTNGTKMTHAQWNIYKESKRAEHGAMYNKWKTVDAEQHAQNVGEELERYKARLMKGSASMANALRYVIMYDGFRGFHWWFAKGPSSHSELKEEYQAEIDKDHRCVGGGFYCRQGGNALQNLTQKFLGHDSYLFKEQILYLFGTSDSYGLDKDHFFIALSQLPNVEDMEIRIMFDGWQFETYKPAKFIK